MNLMTDVTNQFIKMFGMNEQCKCNNCNGTGYVLYINCEAEVDGKTWMGKPDPQNTIEYINDHSDVRELHYISKFKHSNYGFYTHINDGSFDLFYFLPVTKKEYDKRVAEAEWNLGVTYPEKCDQCDGVGHIDWVSNCTNNNKSKPISNILLK